MPVPRLKIFSFFILLLMVACSRSPKIYSSDCNDGHTFKHASLSALADSMAFYNNKYIEISGKFMQDKGISTITGDKPGEVILVEFSNECPLFLTGTRVGFFDYDNNNGQLTPANNKTVVLRGEMIYHIKQKINVPKASISHVSYVRF